LQARTGRKVGLEGVLGQHTDGLAGVCAHLLEPLGGSVLVLAAVLGDVAGHFGRLIRADGLDVGWVVACAAQLLALSASAYFVYSERILLDSSEEACRRCCDDDARSDSEDREDGGGLCEHGVDFKVVFLLEWWVLMEFGMKENGEKSK
jgi:hypothetical protein